MSKLLDKGLIDALESCKELPSPPVVASRIIELGASPSSDVQTLAEIIHLDPSLSAKILSMANSSLYMRRVKADSVQQAVSMFGWTGTLNIAMSFSVVGSIRASLSESFDYNFFWLRSLGAATAARLIRENQSQNDRETLFLAGLLQDIGVLALDRLQRNLYSKLNNSQRTHASLIEKEMDVLGVDHALIGEWLLKTWRLPHDISTLVGASHLRSVERTDIDQQMHEVVYLSGLLSDCLCAPENHEHQQRAYAEMEEILSYDTEAFISLIDVLAAQLQEMILLFDIAMPDATLLERARQRVREVIRGGSLVLEI